MLFFFFWEERDIKFVQKYLFTPDFNRDRLRKTKETYLKWVTTSKVILGQTIGRFGVITPYFYNRIIRFLIAVNYNFILFYFFKYW